MDSTANIDPRRLSRILAVQFLFSQHQSADLAAQNYSPFEPNSLATILEEKKFNNKLYEKIVEGVESKKDELDQMIREAAPVWPLEQINPVDLVILRAAIWEGFIEKVTPYKVVINEAIEIAKVMSTDDSSSFINGVLGTILKKFPNESK